MKLLLITDAFLPSFAPRMGYLCKNLTERGWDITVITEQQQEKFFTLDWKGIHIHTFSYYQEKEESKHRWEWFGKFLATALWDYKNKEFYHLCKKVVLHQKFDCVLCSTFYYFPLGAALQISQFLNAPLVCDLRDLPEQFSKHEYQAHKIKFSHLNHWIASLYEKIQIHRRNKVLYQSHAIISVSPWHVQFLQTLLKNKKATETLPEVHLIYNGYQSSVFFPKDSCTSTFRIVYTGKVLSIDMEDPTLFLQALEHLIQQKKVNAQQIAVDWYTDAAGQSVLESVYPQYPLCKSCSHFLHRVPATKVPSLLQESSVALVLSNKQDKEHSRGIMTTKFFEALGVEKPVLCVRSDEGYLADLIEKTQAGKACSTVEEVEEFLLQKYQEWQTQGFTRQPVNAALKKSFSREEQATTFERIITS